MNILTKNQNQIIIKYVKPQYWVNNDCKTSTPCPNEVKLSNQKKKAMICTFYSVSYYNYPTQYIYIHISSFKLVLLSPVFFSFQSTHGVHSFVIWRLKFLNSGDSQPRTYDTVNGLNIPYVINDWAGPFFSKPPEIWNFTPANMNKVDYIRDKYTAIY